MWRKIEINHFDLISSHIMTLLKANMVSRNRPAKLNSLKSSDNPPAYEQDENLLVIGIDFGTM